MTDAPAAPACAHLLRVLVVDDDDDHLLLTAAVLGERFCVGTARSAQAALRVLANGHWDALVLDYHLPDLSAAELLEHLAASDRALPAVVVTAQPTEDEARAALRSGAAAYMVKSAASLDALPLALLRAIERDGLRDGTRVPRLPS